MGRFYIQQINNRKAWLHITRPYKLLFWCDFYKIQNDNILLIKYVNLPYNHQGDVFIYNKSTIGMLGYILQGITNCYFVVCFTK